MLHSVNARTIGQIAFQHLRNSIGPIFSRARFQRGHQVLFAFSGLIVHCHVLPCVHQLLAYAQKVTLHIQLQRFEQTGQRLDASKLVGDCYQRELG